MQLFAVFAEVPNAWVEEAEPRRAAWKTQGLFLPK